MKKNVIFLVLIVMFSLDAIAAAKSQKTTGLTMLPYQNPKLSLDTRVDDLLMRMTLAEKIAQLSSIWLGADQSPLFDSSGNFNAAAAAEQMKDGLGVVTDPSMGMASDLLDQTGPYRRKNPLEAAQFANAIQQYVITHTRLKIPVLMHEEGLHGLAAKGATSFPQAIALASTFDPALVEQAFTIAARETRSRGAHHLLTPVLDLARDPRWGRTEETYGEDPYLVSRIGVAAIFGMQGRGERIDEQHVMATTKHFAVHGQPEGGTNIAPGNLSQRLIMETYLPPFYAAVTEAKVRTVMPSYNEVDGVPSHANTQFLQQILRKEWGFKGLIVSDYFAIAELSRRHHVAADEAEAARLAIEAGVDIELPSREAYPHLVELVRRGKINIKTIDKAVAHVLHAKFELGLFENPFVDPERAARIAESQEAQALAYKAAQEAIVLLKNEPQLLPLNRSKIKSIAVIGPNADVVLLGGYSGVPSHAVSLLQGVQQAVGTGIKVTYAQGCEITADKPASWFRDKITAADPQRDQQLIAQAAAIAKEADVVILAVGENMEISREAYNENHLGDRDSLDLFGAQEDLIKALVATQKPIVAVLIGGRPLAVRSLVAAVPAIIESWYLGQAGGRALADVIFGDYNPAGRLPISFPRNVGQIPAFYNHKPTARRGYAFSDITPLYAFGHGLSYTTFAYSNVTITPTEMTPKDKVVVSVDVKNSGSRDGEEVVQLYIHEVVSSVTRPVKELKGFRRIALKAGQTQTVSFTLGFAELSLVNLAMKRVVEPGTFEVMVGGNSTATTRSTFKVVVVGRKKEVLQP